MAMTGSEWTAELQGRLERLRRLMAEAGFDALLLTSAENHRYACGFHNPDGQVLLTPETAYVFADFRYTEAARREIPASLFRVICPEGKRSDWLPPCLDGAAVLGYEDDRLSCRAFAALQSDLPGVRLAPLGTRLTELRAVKTPFEAERIVAAQRIAEAAFGDLLRELRYEMTETEVAAELEYRMKKRGAEDKSFDTIAVSGTASSSPHGVPRPRRLEKGFLTLDFGATVAGYHSDMTRTVVIGRADAEMKRLYGTVLRAQREAIAAVAAGVSCTAVDRVAREIIEEGGYRGCFGHSLGHGVGLEIHELPVMGPRDTGARLRTGEVVTVEPGIYLAGKYGCRIEDMVYLSPDGAVDLTLAGRELTEL